VRSGVCGYEEGGEWVYDVGERVEVDGEGHKVNVVKLNSALIRACNPELNLRRETWSCS
jgi:hypothetical protein